MSYKTIALLAVLAATLLFVAPAAAQDPDVEADPQVTEGTNLTIAEASIDDDGFVGIHTESAEGGYTADTFVGGATIEEGEHEDVEVTLDEELEERQILYASLYDGDEVEADAEQVTVDNESVDDSFFVVIGDPEDENLSSSYQTLADLLQERHELRQSVDDLETRLDELEESDDEDVEDQRDSIRDEIDDLNEDLDEVDGQIEETDENIEEVLELREDIEENESDSGDGNDSGGEGLPGFTAVAALLALVATALVARRNA
ncbi:MAG: DUF7282 domain-containing protein [Halobacteriota archaeon]